MICVSIIGICSQLLEDITNVCIWFLCFQESLQSTESQRIGCHTFSQHETCVAYEQLNYANNIKRYTVKILSSKEFPYGYIFLSFSVLFVCFAFYFQILDESAKILFFIFREEGNNIRGGNGHTLYDFNNYCRYVTFLLRQSFYDFNNYYRYVRFLLRQSLKQTHF